MAIAAWCAVGVSKKRYRGGERMGSNHPKRSGLRNFGFALQWAWVCVSFYGMLLYSNASEPFFYIELNSIVQPVASAISLLVLAIGMKRSRVGGSAILRLVVVAGGFVGTFVMYFAPGVVAGTGTVLFVAGVALSSAANSVLLIMWSEYYSGFTTLTAMKYVSVSIALGSFLAFGIISVPGMVGVLVTAFLPCLSVILLPREILDAVEQPRMTKAPSKYPLPLALMVGLVIYGAAFGLMPGLFALNTEGYLGTSRVALLFIGVTVLLFAIACVALPSRFRFDLVAKMVLPLLAAGFILLPVDNGPLAFGFMKAGETMFDMVLWIVLFDTVSRSSSYSAASIFSYGRFMAHVGRIIGVVLISAITTSFHIDGTMLGVIALGVVYALIVTSTFALDWKKMLGRKGSHGKDAADSEAKYRALQERYGFTARELEVLSLVEKGRSGPSIAKKLTIAESTVKTHIHHIYDKVGVTTKQELLDAIENVDVNVDEFGL